MDEDEDEDEEEDKGEAEDADVWNWLRVVFAELLLYTLGDANMGMGGTLLRRLILSFSLSLRSNLRW